MYQRNKPGNGPRTAPVAEINDPLSTIGDPSGFPRLLTFELRPFQVVHTPNQVLMLYMFEKRWRVIWTDGRQLPKEPDPRWYGYSVGRWEDDTTFVVETVGMDDRTWVDNSGYPHSTSLRVTERYQRVSQNTLELTVTIDDPLVYTKPWIAAKQAAAEADAARDRPDGDDPVGVRGAGVHEEHLQSDQVGRVPRSGPAAGVASDSARHLVLSERGPIDAFPANRATRGRVHVPAAGRRVGAEQHHRRRQGHVGRGAARRDRRGQQPRAHRGFEHGGDRQPGAVPHR